MTYRLLFLVPLLLALVILLFLLNNHTISDQFFKASESGYAEAIQFDQSDELWNQLASQHGWGQPPFYITIANQGWDNAFYRDYNFQEQKLVTEVAKLTLNAEHTRIISDHIVHLSVDREHKPKLKFLQTGDLKSFFESVVDVEDDSPFYQISTSYQEALKQRSFLDALPRIQFVGLKNRFHHFVFHQLLSGNVRSVVDGVPVFKKIWPAVSITAFINLVALILLLLIGIPLGLFLYRSETSRRAAIVRAIMYVLFAMPLFYLATLVLNLGALLPGGFLTGIPELQANETPSLLTFLRPKNIGFFLLPILAVILNVAVIVAIQMYRALKETSDKKFILAAQTRGLTAKQILTKHNRPVALYSILTLVGNSLPMLISGSIVIEIIFNIPGMGRLLWSGLYDYDWGLVMGLLLVGALFSVIGQLFTDVAYYYFNPQMNSAV